MENSTENPDCFSVVLPSKGGFQMVGYTHNPTKNFGPATKCIFINQRTKQKTNRDGSPYVEK